MEVSIYQVSSKYCQALPSLGPKDNNGDKKKQCRRFFYDSLEFWTMTNIFKLNFNNRFGLFKNTFIAHKFLIRIGMG